MISIPGYEILETIYEGARTVVYRGKLNREQQLVIIKVLKAEYPALEEITRLRQEYTITKNIECQGIVKAYSLEKYQNTFALILEDFGGQSLSQFLTTNQLRLTEVLHIAIALAEILIQLHKVEINHKDIKPSNIIINPETKQVKITDFSIASRLGLENQTISNPDLLEGTLAYMSR